MPKVPAPLTQPGVQQAANPNVRMNTDAPIEAFGGGSSRAAVTQAAVGMGRQAMEIAQEEKKKADDVATTEAYTKTVQLRNRLMYDPETGAMTKKGKDAFGVKDQYLTEFQKGADEIEATLASEDQKRLYRRIREQELRDLDGGLMRHTFQEAKAYDQETSEAALKTAQEDAVMNYQDPAKLKSALEMQKTLVRAHADRNGLSEEVLNQRLQAVESGTHAAVVKRMLSNGQDLAASGYFRSVKDKMLGSDAAQVEAALEEGSLRGESQRRALTITQNTQDLTAALAEVDKIKDPKVQDATRERVKTRFSEMAAAREQAQTQNFHQAFSIAEQAKLRGQSVRDAIPPDMYEALTPQQKNSINALASKDMIETNWGLYYNLKTMAASPQLRNKFLGTDLILHRPELGDAEFKELVNAQTEARKGNTSTLDGFRSDQQIVNDSLNAAGIDPTPRRGSKDAEKVNQFRKRVDDEVKKRQEMTGKKITNEEMQGIVDSLMIKGVTEKGWFWDTEKHLFELEPGVDKKFDFDIKKVPPTERQRIESALKSKGIEVTDDKILEMYRRKLAGMVKRGN